MRKIVALAVLLASFSADAAFTMNLSSPQQTWAGAGAATSIFGANGVPNEGAWSDAQLDLMFTTLQFNIARIGIASANAGTGSKFEDNNPGFNNQLLDCKRILARNPSVKIIALPWSPNTACKSSSSLLTGSFIGGGTCNTSWSTYMGQAVDDAQNAGCPLYAVAAQNEPDFDPGGGHEGATMTKAVSTAFLKALGPVLAAKSPAPLLMCCDMSQWINAYTATGTGYIDDCTADGTCLAAVGLWSTHAYTPAGAATAPGVLSGKQIWMTEVSDLNAVNNAMTGTGGGLDAGAWIYASINTGQASAVVAWWGVTHNNNDDGLINNDGVTTTKRLYVWSHFSRFVKPGMVRFGILGSPPANVSVLTFKDPVSNNVVVWAMNNQASTAALTVILDATSKVGVVTPWLTDGTHDATAQTPVAVTASSFSFTLPANSVVSFVGNGT